MAMNADLLEILSPAPARLVRLAAPPLTYREVQQGHHPGRGLGLSILFHLSVFLLIISGRSLFVYAPRMVAERAWQPTDSASVVLYLPVLGGGSEGGGHVGGGSSNTAKASSGLRSRSRRGFAYPGPQPMASSPPRATLGIQTILQPALVSPPLLKRDLPLPNIVRPAAPPVTAAAQDAIVVKGGKLTLPPNPDPPVAAPKITLPAAQSSAITDLVMVKPTLPEKPTPANAPLPSDVSVMPDVRRHQEGLLVLNAIPPPPGLHPNLPRAEARGLFAVAPAEATVIADPAAGAKAGEASSPAAGTGTRADIAKGDALAEPATGGNESGRVAGGSGSGNGGRYGSGHGSGLNPAGTGVNTGRGTGSEPGIGEGSGGSRGSGAGAGSAPGTGGFPGIGIQGGRYGNDTASGLHPSVAPRQQTSYNLTIVSTASSGGGLPDLGVFHNEKVYTVYLDMKADDEDPAPAWTLQYAILQPSLNPAETSTKIQGTPTPPYAMLKEIPEFAPDVLRKYAHKLIIACAVMTAAGNLEQITVQQNPDTQLALPLVEALSHWMFHPAQIEGKPIPLKILLGIRLAPGR
jgi:hypothetical protein